MSAVQLWHYTCHHGLAGIVRDGLVKPVGQLLDTSPTVEALGWLKDVAWFTDLAHVDRDALGLSSVALGCDRTRFRFRVVDSTEARRFGTFRYVDFRRALDPQARPLADVLESVPGAMPMHWWVSVMPLQVVLA